MRNPWTRIFLFVLSVFGILVLIFALVSVPFPEILTAEFESGDLVYGTVQLAMLFLSIVAGVIFFSERAVWKALLFVFPTKHFFIGSAFALIILPPAAFVLVLCGWADFELQANEIFGFQLIYFFLVAVTEELLSRGFILHTLRTRYSTLSAIIMSSVIFALMHLANDHLGIIGLTNLTLSGVILSFLYIRSGNLAAPIGMHFVWNVVQGPVMGFSVSGNKGDSFFKLEYHSSIDRLTGGGFGLEGSLILVVIQALCCWYLFRESGLSFAAARTSATALDN